jgi:hypothetical protein
MVQWSFTHSGLGRPVWLAWRQRACRLTHEVGKWWSRRRLGGGARGGSLLAGQAGVVVDSVAEIKEAVEDASSRGDSVRRQGERSGCAVTGRAVSTKWQRATWSLSVSTPEHLPSSSTTIPLARYLSIDCDLNSRSSGGGMRKATTWGMRTTHGRRCWSTRIATSSLVERDPVDLHYCYGYCDFGICINLASPVKPIALLPWLVAKQPLFHTSSQIRV